MQCLCGLNSSDLKIRLRLYPQFNWLLLNNEPHYHVLICYVFFVRNPSGKPYTLFNNNVRNLGDPDQNVHRTYGDRYQFAIRWIPTVGAWYSSNNFGYVVCSIHWKYWRKSIIDMNIVEMTERNQIEELERHSVSLKVPVKCSKGKGFEENCDDINMIAATDR